MSGPILEPEESILQHIESERPNVPVALLSHDERYRLMERGMIGLYRWYVARSQETRNWNPDKSFDWRAYRKDHSDEVNAVVEGFYAVEQYVPDYVSKLLAVIRQSYGRSHFHIRWGAEEERHADLWRNGILFGGRRSQKWVEDYNDTLRGREWHLPWEDPIHMVFYTVFQERATQVNYLNLGLVARGMHPHEVYKNDADPVLAQMCQTIAADEAAHYNFFLESARLFLYYFPDDSVQAIADVIRHFGMPAGDIIPDYDMFAELLQRTAIFGMRHHLRDVVAIALKQLGSDSVRSVEEGIRRSRVVPDEQGQMRTGDLLDSLDFELVDQKVRQLFKKIDIYEREIGFDEVAPTPFVANPRVERYLEAKRLLNPAGVSAGAPESESGD